jgi:hypothetical protein
MCPAMRAITKSLKRFVSSFAGDCEGELYTLSLATWLNGSPVLAKIVEFALRFSV